MNWSFNWIGFSNPKISRIEYRITHDLAGSQAPDARPGVKIGSTPI
jgi:hypothetical protein